MNQIFFRSILPIILLSAVVWTSCSKNKTPYTLTYTQTNKPDHIWSADKVEAIILNDSLMITGRKKKDKSEIAIIISDTQVGDYEIIHDGLTFPGSLDNINFESIIIINPDGTSNVNSNLISLDGRVSITSHDTKRKMITGNFNIQAVKGSDLINLKTQNITGEFETKYIKY